MSEKSINFVTVMLFNRHMKLEDDDDDEEEEEEEEEEEKKKRSFQALVNINQT